MPTGKILKFLKFIGAIPTKPVEEIVLKDDEFDHFVEVCKEREIVTTDTLKTLPKPLVRH